MIDFRYHALSLVAVFLALAIGIVLGVTIGDSLLSQAEKGVRSSLHRDVISARANLRNTKSELSARDRLIETVYPRLVAGRLRGRRIAVVGWGGLPNAVLGSIRDAVSTAGGKLDSVSVFEPPAADLRRVVGSRTFSSIARSQAALDKVGRTLGQGVAVPNGLIGQLTTRARDHFQGQFRGADAVLLYQSPADPAAKLQDPGAADRARKRASTLEQGLLEGLADEAVPVVGVEDSGANPSQVPFFQSHKLTSVDSVDLVGGRVALVYALLGAKGSFGFKATADAPLPPPPRGR